MSVHVSCAPVASRQKHFCTHRQHRESRGMNPRAGAVDGFRLNNHGEVFFSQVRDLPEDLWRVEEEMEMKPSSSHSV